MGRLFLRKKIDFRFPVFLPTVQQNHKERILGDSQFVSFLGDVFVKVLRNANLGTNAFHGLSLPSVSVQSAPSSKIPHVASSSFAVAMAILESVFALL